MPVEFSEEAREDLREILIFLSDWSERVAAATVDELEGISRGLADSPERHRVWIRHAGLDVRRCPWRRYNIYYAADGERVRILRIVHHARDQGAIFGSSQVRRTP